MLFVLAWERWTLVSDEVVCAEVAGDQTGVREVGVAVPGPAAPKVDCSVLLGKSRPAAGSLQHVRILDPRTCGDHCGHSLLEDHARYPLRAACAGWLDLPSSQESVRGNLLCTVELPLLHVSVCLLPPASTKRPRRRTSVLLVVQLPRGNMTRWIHGSGHINDNAGFSTGS